MKEAEEAALRLVELRKSNLNIIFGRFILSLILESPASLFIYIMHVDISICPWLSQCACLYILLCLYLGVCLCLG